MLGFLQPKQDERGGQPSVPPLRYRVHQGGRLQQDGLPLWGNAGLFLGNIFLKIKKILKIMKI